MRGRLNRTYQEHDGNVEQEGAQAIEKEGEEADVVHVGHGAPWHFPRNGDDKVHGRADGRKVVQRDQGVHLVLGRAKQHLDHAQAQGLEDNAAQLEDDADDDELDLSHRGDDDAEDNDRHVQKHPEARLGNSKGPGGDQDGDRCCGLKTQWLAVSS